jgi:hypothetical protein
LLARTRASRLTRARACLSARSAELQARLGELSGRSLAGALWAHAKLGHGPLRLLPAAAPHVRARAADMNTQELANAAWAYATAATRGACDPACVQQQQAALV